jgi:threonine dehydratase
MLIAIEKTVVEGAGAVGLAAVLAAPERFAGCHVGLVLTGGNIDTRLIASVLTRELAREGRLTQIAIDIVDRPGQLAAVSALLAEAGANIIEVSHQRTFSDLPAKGTLLEVVIETRDRVHLEDVMKRLGEAGFVAWLPGRGKEAFSSAAEILVSHKGNRRQGDVLGANPWKSRWLVNA